MMEFDVKIQEFASTIMLSAKKQAIKKVVFSKSKDKSIIKTIISLKNISGKHCLQAESFHADNKAKHENISLESSSLTRICELMDSFMQVNLITTMGECEFKSSKSGKITLIGVNALRSKLDSQDVSKAEISGNNQ